MGNSNQYVLTVVLGQRDGVTVTDTAEGLRRSSWRCPISLPLARR